MNKIVILKLNLEKIWCYYLVRKIFWTTMYAVGR